MSETSTARPPRRSRTAPPPNGESAASAPDPKPETAPTFESALDAGGEAAPALDTAQLEAVAQAVESPAVAPSVESSGTASPPGVSSPAAAQPSSSSSSSDLWSKRRISKAKASDLRRYVAELQARVPSPESAEGKAAAPLELTPQDKLANLTTALGASIHLAGGFLVKLFQSEHMVITRPESSELADAWAPIALPHYDKIVEGIPWAIALGKTYEIGSPKIDAMLRERKARKASSEPASSSSEVVAADAPRE